MLNFFFHTVFILVYLAPFLDTRLPRTPDRRKCARDNWHFNWKRLPGHKDFLAFIMNPKKWDQWWRWENIKEHILKPVSLLVTTLASALLEEFIELPAGPLRGKFTCNFSIFSFNWRIFSSWGTQEAADRNNDTLVYLLTTTVFVSCGHMNSACWPIKVT